MNKQSKSSGEIIYLVEYDDAAFSYENFSLESLERLNTVKSIGWIREKNENFLNLGIEREIGNNKIEYLKGILIPVKAIRSITELYGK